MTVSSSPALIDGQLVLADGSVFEGELIGAVSDSGNGSAIATGEVVFNTALSGYQEIITDPSYAGQMIAFTYPHIGNYGVNATDNESRGAFNRGVIVRDLARRYSNYRADGSLDAMLKQYGIPGIAGIDTRRLTRILRDTGAMGGAFGTGSVADLTAAAKAEPGTSGVDLVSEVTTAESYTVAADTAAGADPKRLIVAYDFGIKTMIVRHLSRYGTVTVVPSSTPSADVLAMNPAGVFLSNGPGDPEVNTGVIGEVGKLIGNVPLFGICLGHQLLGLALGAGTVKLPFGHHGGNHPVKNLDSGVIEITSQNHNFAVDPDSFTGLGKSVRQTHVNLNDGVCEGLEVVGERCFSVQHHPEAGPGPHDSTYLFDQFDAIMKDGSN